MTVTTSPPRRGEHEVSRNTIAQGMSDCLRCPVCSCAPSFACAYGTRDLGCSVHPAFPAPSVFGGANELNSSGENCVARIFPLVIPGRAKHEPGIHNHRRLLVQRKPLTVSRNNNRHGVWIPGPRQGARPGMTEDSHPQLTPRHAPI